MTFTWNDLYEPFLTISSLAFVRLFHILQYSVDVLVSELNFGAASRWVEAAERVPVPSRSTSTSEKQVTTTDLNRDSNKRDYNMDVKSKFHPL